MPSNPGSGLKLIWFEVKVVVPCSEYEIDFIESVDEEISFLRGFKLICSPNDRAKSELQMVALFQL